MNAVAKNNRKSKIEKRPYLCTCGKEGFVDIGADQTNRYPCRQCYEALLASRQMEIAGRREHG